MLGRVQCSWLTTRIPSSRKWAIPRMCSPVEDKRCGHVNQEKVIPWVYSTGRGPALHHLPLPRRPGLAVGLLSVLSLPAWKAVSRGAGRGLCPWPRFFDLLSSGTVVQRVCVTLRVYALFCDLQPGLSLSSWSCWLFLEVVFLALHAAVEHRFFFFVFLFLCSWWSVLVLPLSWGPQRSGRASDELRTASSSRICGTVFIRRLERSML